MAIEQFLRGVEAFLGEGCFRRVGDQRDIVRILGKQCRETIVAALRGGGLVHARDSLNWARALSINSRPSGVSPIIRLT